jgi:hypothetical protein
MLLIQAWIISVSLVYEWEVTKITPDKINVNGEISPGGLRSYCEDARGLSDIRPRVLADAAPVRTPVSVTRAQTQKSRRSPDSILDAQKADDAHA